MSLASRFNGEIINADAIQMYRGLPIVTNKIPERERNGIAHHLLDQIGLDEVPWTVHQFVQATSKIIDEIRARGKLPIVVGGTNYYVFSLIFEESTVLKSDSNDEWNSDGQISTTESELAILEAPTEVLLAKLREIDPVIANSWHPQDRRKIQRSLEICLRNGKKVSEIYKMQRLNRLQTASDPENSVLRLEPLIFWLDAEDAVLKTRLNERVDAMVRDGLLEEVQAMRTIASEMKSTGAQLDRGKGIWIAIGYKELEPWLNARSASSDDHETLTALRNAGIEAVKAGTRQYAKRQNRWVRIRLAQHLKAANWLQKLFLLDGTNIEHWDEAVERPCEDITQKYLSGESLPENSSLSKLASLTFDRINDRDQFPTRHPRFCETCQKTLMTDAEWSKHIKSARHKKILDGIRKRASLEQSTQTEATANV